VNTAAAQAATERPRRRPRLRTLVFGLLLGLLAAMVIVSETTGDDVDGAALAIATLIGSGLILLAGAVGAAWRGDSSGDG
jgi:peptidoglycan/LPS O-acetylase OafA/YrhL